jgi:hypothetical protein
MHHANMRGEKCPTARQLADSPFFELTWAAYTVPWTDSCVVSNVRVGWHH